MHRIEIERLLEDGSREALYKVLRYAIRYYDKGLLESIQGKLPFKPFSFRDEKLVSELLEKGFLFAGRKWKQYPACKCIRDPSNADEVYTHLMENPGNATCDPSHCSLRKCRKRHLTWLLLPPKGVSKTKAKKEVDRQIKKRKARGF